MNAEIPTLRVRSVVKRYGSVSALRGVDLDVRAGEIVALVGDNGAGKSTLVKIIAGATPLTEGTIEFEGQPVTLSNPKASADLGIATIYQDLALCDNLDVVSNLFLGRELGPGLGRGARLLDTATMENRARTLLERFNVRLANLRAPVAALSGGQRQSVAIARSLIGDPKVVLLDEPTAALGVAQTAQVLDFVSRLADEGHAVVLISHNLADVFAVCHRISVLHQGRNAGDFEVGSVTQDDVVAAITGSAQVGAGRRPGLPSTSALRQKGPTE